jgi:hypothetical protein
MAGTVARTLIVGDLHGCLDELVELLGEVGFAPGEDRLISVGDLVGKGPKGAEVVRFFREGGHEAVRGNHDDRLLLFHHGVTKKPLGPAHRADAERMSAEDWRWLDATPLTLALPEHGTIVVHGGLVPGVPLSEQRACDLMNLRSIRPDGSPSKRVDDGEPWARLWPGPAVVVFGHDAIRGLQRWPHAIGLDSGCVYGGALSMLVLPERRVVSVRAHATYVPREDA